MLNFAWPWLALLLVLPWAWRFLPLRRAAPPPEPLLLRHPALDYLHAAFSDPSGRVAPRQQLRLLLHSLLWALLVLALMRPQWLEAVSEVQPWGYDVMLVVDTSCSMEALDFTLQGRAVSRMQAIRQILEELVGTRPGDRIGLVAFGDDAQLVMPLTLDNAAVRDAVYNLEPGILGGSTAIGDALAIALNKLRERPEGSRVLILVTDGDNTAGQLKPEVVAPLAKRYGVHLHVIGVGSDQPTIEYAPERREHGDCARLTSPDSNTIFNEKILQAVAQSGQGQYFRATDTQALNTISRQIDALEKTQATTTTRLVPQELYRWPLAFALLPLLGLSLWRIRQGF